MIRSLQEHLSIGLSIAIVCMGLLAGLASFELAFDEAQAYQDASLRQIAVLIPPEHGPTVEKSVATPLDEDPDARIVVQALATSQPSTAALLKLPIHLSSGFHTVNVGGQNWRVFVRRVAPGRKLAVAQSTDVRSDAAVDSALRTLMPLLLLVPLLIVFARYLVLRSLAPVQALALAADSQNAEYPGPLSVNEVPEEIAPFLRAINRLLERVRLLMTQQRRFVANAAHELRTPLTALSLQAQNLERAESLAECKQRLLPLKSGLERSRHLLDQLLSLARQQAAVATHQPVDLAAIARLIVEDLYPLAEQKNLDFGLELQGAVWVEGTEAALYSLIRNAVDNALHYSPENGEVTIRICGNGEEGVVEVIDNGPGIPPEESHRVFDAFYRLPGSVEGGSGLGLTIARHIADQLGGQITLSSRSDRQGLVFMYRQRLVTSP